MSSTKFYNKLLDDGKLINSFYKEDPFHAQKLDFVLKQVGKNKTVLDIGCNEGQIGEELIKKGNIVYGIDILNKGLIKAKKKGLIVRRVDIETNDFPYPNNFFDSVVLADFIEHIFDTDSLLRKCRKVLKKNGKLIITTPNVASLARRIMLFFGIAPFVEHSIELPVNGLVPAGHIRYYTVKTLKEQLKYHHYSDVNMESDAVNFVYFRNKFLGKILPSFGVMLMASCKK
jgi:O-antigen biosynthesis protein